MANKNNKHAAPTIDPRQVRILVYPTYYESLEFWKTNGNAQVLKALLEFIESKRNNPLAPYGAKDYPFKQGELKGIPHAALANDARVVYDLEGSNPRRLSLYGVYTHDQLGTGQPINIERQNQMAIS